MRIAIPSTGPLGDRLEIWTIREADDPPVSIPWAFCIRRLDGTLVYEQQVYHDVDFDPDIKVHIADITPLSGGVYRLDIYNWNSCNPPDGVDTYSVYIQKGGDTVALRMHVDWFPERNYIFVMYVYDGKLFYRTESGRVTFIPRGADTYVEITGSDGRAFVGVVNATSDVIVAPNVYIPFKSTVRIRFDRPVAWNVAHALVLPVRHVAVSVVDDYTVDIIITKTDVGIAPLVAGIIMLALVAVTTVSVAYIVSMQVSVEVGRQQIIESLVEEKNKVVNAYINEVNQCTDEQCINRTQLKYMPILASINEAIGEVYGKTCDGVELFGSCVPWYVFVIIAAFVLAVLVVR